MKMNQSPKATAEKAIVIGVGLKTEDLVEIKESLSELEELVYSAGGEVVVGRESLLPMACIL